MGWAPTQQSRRLSRLLSIAGIILQERTQLQLPECVVFMRIPIPSDGAADALWPQTLTLSGCSTSAIPHTCVCVSHPWGGFRTGIDCYHQLPDPGLESPLSALYTHAHTHTQTPTMQRYNATPQYAALTQVLMQSPRMPSPQCDSPPQVPL